MWHGCQSAWRHSREETGEPPNSSVSQSDGFRLIACLSRFGFGAKRDLRPSLEGRFGRASSDRRLSRSPTRRRRFGALHSRISRRKIAARRDDPRVPAASSLQRHAPCAALRERQCARASVGSCASVDPQPNSAWPNNPDAGLSYNGIVDCLGRCFTLCAQWLGLSGQRERSLGRRFEGDDATTADERRTKGEILSTLTQEYLS